MGVKVVVEKLGFANYQVQSFVPGDSTQTTFVWTFTRWGANRVATQLREAGKYVLKRGQSS